MAPHRIVKLCSAVTSSQQCVGLGFYELDVQGLRHTFASIMLELYPIAKVNRWLGHANSEVTMKIYAHFVKTNDRSDTMDRLSTAVFAGEKQADEKSVRHELGTKEGVVD